MAGSNNENFDLQVVHDNFLSCLHEEDDVKLKFYLDSYNELNKFFTLMGTVFGFVSKDLKSKMDILFEFLSSEETSGEFDSVRTMIQYEKNNQLLHKKGYVSGSRTLLRLHRGLDFIREFLKSIEELQDQDYTGPVCRKVYDRTLAHHHSFVIRNGARIAMVTLPAREQLFKKVCGNEEEVKKALELLPKTLEVTAVVYKRVDTLYTVHDLHSLP